MQTPSYTAQHEDENYDDEDNMETSSTQPASESVEAIPPLRGKVLRNVPPREPVDNKDSNDDDNNDNVDNNNDENNEEDNDRTDLQADATMIPDTSMSSSTALTEVQSNSNIATLSEAESSPSDDELRVSHKSKKKKKQMIPTTPPSSKTKSTSSEMSKRSPSKQKASSPKKRGRDHRWQRSWRWKMRKLLQRL